MLSFPSQHVSDRPGVLEKIDLVTANQHIFKSGLKGNILLNQDFNE